MEKEEEGNVSLTPRYPLSGRDASAYGINGSGKCEGSEFVFDLIESAIPHSG
jgi:hypothetical protein